MTKTKIDYLHFGLNHAIIQVCHLKKEINFGNGLRIGNRKDLLANTTQKNPRRNYLTLGNGKGIQSECEGESTLRGLNYLCPYLIGVVIMQTGRVVSLRLQGVCGVLQNIINGGKKYWRETGAFVRTVVQHLRLMLTMLCLFLNTQSWFLRSTTA